MHGNTYYDRQPAGAGISCTPVLVAALSQYVHVPAGYEQKRSEIGCIQPYAREVGEVTMPLLPGKKNLFRNAQVEMAHGKSRGQAFAIAYSVLRKGKKTK